MTRATRAFTILETLLALALVVVLSGAVFSFLLSLGARRAAFEGESRGRRAAMTALDRMSGDLACAIAGDPEFGPGIVGADTSVRILTRGVDLDAAVQGRARGAADLLACTYAFRGGAIAASREAIGPGAPPSAEPSPVCPGVRSVRFRYFDGRSWRDSFDSAAAGGLPRAVEVRVWLGDAPADSGADAGRADETLVVAIPDAAGDAP